MTVGFCDVEIITPLALRLVIQANRYFIDFSFASINKLLSLNAVALFFHVEQKSDNFVFGGYRVLRGTEDDRVVFTFAKAGGRQCGIEYLKEKFG